MASAPTSDRRTRADFLAEAEAKRRKVMDDLNQPGATVAAVAQANGISRQRVHQIRKQQAGVPYR